MVPRSLPRAHVGPGDFYVGFIPYPSQKPLAADGLSPSYRESQLDMNQVVFDSSLGCAVQTRSCDHCFHRKIKCDRRTPCSPCQENHAVCQYERPRKKRRYIRPASVDPDVNSRVSSERPNILYEESADWLPVETIEVSPPPEARQQVSVPVNNATHTQITTVSPAQLETEYWDIGMGECFFYPTNLLGVVDLPPFAPSLSLNIPASPGLYLSPPLQHLSSQNGVLDRLLDDSTIPQLIDVFLERLQQSMPFFTRSYLHQNIARQRHLQDRSFGSLVQAICSLVLLQPVQSQEKRSWPNREARADAHLALAVNLHSQSDLGQSPTLETIMTSVFLFACQFCKGNFDAARFRLREAAALAEVMNLDKPESYGRIGDTEKQRRLRTLISLTIIERIYSVQRDYVPGTKLLSRNKLQELQNAIASSHDRGESENIIAMECISNMLEQVDFIDPDIIKCWKGFCWEEEAPTHVTRSTILTLLRRYRVLPQFSGSSDIDTHAQHADILVTRHWIRIKLWSLANSHGYVEALSENEEFRREYAVTIASEALDTCLQFQMTSLEVHGIGLVEKLSDLATCAAQQANVYSPAQEHPIHAHLSNPDPNGIQPQEDSPTSSSSSGTVNNGAEEMLNGYLSLFASFRRGKHPFLKPVKCTTWGRYIADSSSDLSSPPANPDITELADRVLREVLTQLNDINTQLGTINDRLDNLEATVRDHGEHLARLDRRVTRQSSKTINFRAKMLNIPSSDPDTALVPLVNPVTGEKIPDFPRTHGEVQRLNGRELGALLRALNLRDTRNAEQKRADFLDAIGATD
ncbi:transcription activator amyR [Fusarium sp. NRRL 52700]|nr:transcription activator amyR [Fusarium sp. NRRL 52700]